MKKIVALLISISLVAISLNVSAPSPGPERESGLYEDPAQEGSAQGISWKPVVPIKNAIFVNYDKESYIDDYAYLASVPAAVFYSDSQDEIYSSPLLFYQKPEELGDEEKVLNAASGIDYFMEDWLIYSDGTMDTVQFINIPQEDVDGLKGKWSTDELNIIEEDCPIKIAKEMALFNWEYSDSAVVAVIDDVYEDIDVATTNKVNGSISGSIPIRVDVIEGSATPDPVDPIFHDFNIESDYKYITSYMEWYGPTGLDTINDLTQRGKDPDLQLYSDDLGEVAASENWNVLTGAHESIGSYIYHSGNWASAVTYMPTESVGQNDDPEANFARGTRGPFDEATYEITNTFYPGIDLELPDETPFFCRQANFKLTWEDTNANLGLVVLGPSGAEIAKDVGTDRTKEIELMELGEGKYTISVVRLSDSSSDVSFEVDYSWHQTKEKREGDNLASATQGAVFASVTNSPLLFTKRSSLSSYTKSALDTLGVKKVYVIDLGGHSKGDVADAIKNSRSLLQPKIKVKEINGYETIYKMIQEKTNQYDIVFSTINPWTYWHIGVGPKGEEKGGLFLGPAAYAAAHHGCPVFITDMHPELSTANAWHNHFWKNAYLGRLPPSVGCMVLTGTQVYRFLDDMGFDKDNLKFMESILTVAGQFDIGTSWDRVFVGAALPGRILGSPVDTSYWTSRSALYQAIIFANPALDQKGVTMTTGSSSRTYNGLVITEPEKEVTAQYPLLQSWVSYDHRFNERGSLYWGSDYVCADGITPYRSPSDDPIDKDGKWPDITTSEVVPYYAEKAGYSSVFSTNFDVTMENLNSGAIMWLEVMHGGNRDSGVVGFWNPDQVEPNPWRSYEDGGSTFEPDTAVMSKNTGLDYIRNPFPTQQLHDGVIICLLTQFTQTVSKNGYDFDNAMENLHSLGFSAGSCLIANTYLQLAMIRHGSVFPIIDPWLTSWYCGFAIQTFVRDVALGYSVGEAYERGIRHVGIEYLTGQWWWDIYENVVYYGDPDLRVYSPKYAWDEPEPLPVGSVIDGHSPFGATGHPHAIQSTLLLEILLFSGIFIAVAAGVVIFWRKKRAKTLNGRGV
ncbi:MAG: hypothetical protein JSV56_03455 [Methanomassiliicoccales archaeon]|nr:MAG: hypothetical protein JSV56_03455 [Methanomassiliicoccales archaeon]